MSPPGGGRIDHSPGIVGPSRGRPPATGSRGGGQFMYSHPMAERVGAVRHWQRRYRRLAFLCGVLFYVYVLGLVYVAGVRWVVS